MADKILASASLEVGFERTREGGVYKSQREMKDNSLAQKPPRFSKASHSVPSIASSIRSDACTAIQTSVSGAGFNDVVVTCDKEYAYVQSDTYPDHDLMNGITGTNEQIPVPAENYAAPIRLNPKLATQKTTIDAALGVAVNGVPIYDYSAQGELDPEHYDAKKDTVLLGQLDNCGGHAGRGDDYHYHAKPTCMINTISNADDATILGWGYDGYPLFGDANPDGTVIKSGTLGVCNGKSDANFGYRYHTSIEPPYIFQCLVGEVDSTILPRVSPLRGASARSDLRPPRDGVENLKHSESADGTRTLSYTYKGVQYFSKYTPSKSNIGCFEFEQKTISNNGVLETGTYCRQ